MILYIIEKYIPIWADSINTILRHHALKHMPHAATYFQEKAIKIWLKVMF